MIDKAPLLECSVLAVLEKLEEFEKRLAAGPNILGLTSALQVSYHHVVRETRHMNMVL